MRDIKSAADHQGKTKRVLTIGPAGVGKTTQLLTLPGRKFLYVFDPNALDSLKGAKDIDYLDFIPGPEDLDLSIKTLKKDVYDKSAVRTRLEPTTYIDWEKDFEQRLDSDFFLDYDWLAFDSMTTLSEIVMDRVQHLNKRLGKHPEQADWTAEMNAFRLIFRKATALPIHVYATAHTEIMKDDTIGKTYAQLLITGRNRVRIPIRFTQVYGLEPEGSKFHAITIQDRMHPAVRTTVRGLKPVEDVTINWAKDPVGQGLGAFVLRDKK